MIVTRAHQEQTHCKCYNILHIENFNDNYILTFLISSLTTFIIEFIFCSFLLPLQAYIYNSLKRKNIRKDLWKAIFAHNSFYFYMTSPTPIGYNQNGTTGFQKSLI